MSGNLIYKIKEIIEYEYSKLPRLTAVPDFTDELIKCGETSYIDKRNNATDIAPFDQETHKRPDYISLYVNYENFHMYKMNGDSLINITNLINSEGTVWSSKHKKF